MWDLNILDVGPWFSSDFRVLRLNLKKFGFGVSMGNVERAGAGRVDGTEVVGGEFEPASRHSGRSRAKSTTLGSIPIRFPLCLFSSTFPSILFLLFVCGGGALST